MKSWDMLLSLLLSLLSPVFVTASSSNYSPYQYDFTTPVFTPDGRLLQVEYAAKAVDDFASPLLVVSLNATMRAVVAFAPRTSVLERLVILPSSRPILVALSGVLPDGMALLAQVQDHHRQQQQRLGVQPTAKSLALYTAAQCHGPAMGGGVRPFGARIAFLQSNHDLQNDNVAYLTDPSGTMNAVPLLGAASAPSLEEKNKQPSSSSITVLVGGKEQTRLTRSLSRLGGGSVYSLFKNSKNKHDNHGLPLLRKVLKECTQILQSGDATSTTTTNDGPVELSLYRCQIVLWNTESGDMYAVPAAVVEQLMVQSLA